MNKYNLGAVLQLVGLGWFVAFCIVGGVLVGRWLDQNVFHTSFLFTLLGLALGLSVAFWGLYRMLTNILGDTTNGKDHGKK